MVGLDSVAVHLLVYFLSLVFWDIGFGYTLYVLPVTLLFVLLQISWQTTVQKCTYHKLFS